MTQEEITTLQNAHDKGILLFKGGSSYRISAPSPTWIPPTIETWLLHGNISVYNTCVTAWHNEERLLINKHRKNPNLAVSDNIHETSDSDLLKQHLSVPHSALNNLGQESVDPSIKWFVIATHWSQFNLYHCLFDAIGKLSIASEVFKIEEIEVLLPESFAFLKVLDSMNIRYRTYPKNLLLSGKLYYPSMPGRLGVVPHNVLSFMRKQTSHIKAAYIDNIFIARKAGSKRYIANQHEVLDCLEKLISFSVFYLEDLSFCEQIALFKSAKLVIGPHGAGLSWGAFSEKSDLFEIFPHDYENGCFQTVYGPYAKYGHYVCSLTDMEHLGDPGVQDENETTMHIDIQKFEQVFENFLQSRNN